MKSVAPLAFAAVALAACNGPTPQASPPPTPGSVTVTSSDFHLPEGEDCSAEIARYRAILRNDLSMGHVAQSVYNQFKRETNTAEADCSGGHDAQARSLILASKKRHGYPADL